MTRDAQDYNIGSMGEAFSIGKITRAISIGIRILLTGFGALVLMVLVSYPSLLIEEEPLITLPDISREFLLEWRNWLWVAPWLLMELAALAGPKRNLTWFCGVGGMLVLTTLAYPVIQSLRPELIHPQFADWVYSIRLKEVADKATILADHSPYCDKGLVFGYQILWALMGLSIFLRVVVLGYMAKIHEVRDDNEFNNIDIADIAPDADNARTVKEIAGNVQKTRPDFRFGEADHGLVAHLRGLLQRMQYLRTVKGICWLSAALAVALWFMLYPQPNAQEALERDLEAMYETCTDAEGNEIGTTRAVYAALRVMAYAVNNRNLENITVADAEKWLHLERASAAYRNTIRNENIEELEYRPERLRSSVPYSRFLTITDGRHHAVLVLNLRSNDIDPATGAPAIRPNTPINFPQFFEFGWDKDQDLRRSHPYLYEGYQFNNAVWL